MLEACFWACPSRLHPASGSVPSVPETTRTLAHLSPHLQDPPPKLSPNELEKGGKMAVRRGNEETAAVPSLLPPLPLESTEMGGRVGSPCTLLLQREAKPPFTACLADAQNHHKLEDTLR